MFFSSQFNNSVNFLKYIQRSKLLFNIQFSSSVALIDVFRVLSSSHYFFCYRTHVKTACLIRGRSYSHEDASQTSRASSGMLRLTSILDLKVLCTDLKTTRGSSEGLARRQTLSVVCSEQHMPQHLRMKKTMKKQ